MDRRLSGGGDPRDAGSNSRTPMAWRHRDQLYQQQQGYHGEQLYSAPRSGRSSVGQASRPPRTASPPDTSNSSSLSSDSQVAGLQHSPHGPQHGYGAYGAYGGYGAPPSSASMAAAQAASAWDAEPFYGLPPGMSPGMPPGMPHPGMPHPGMAPGLPGLPPGVLVLPPAYALGPMPPPMAMGPMGPMGPPGPPPALLLPPMLRPRPLVFPAIPTTPTPPEPLPVREPKASLPPKEVMVARSKVRCCRGGCVVLWIILGLILVGALLATALRFVFP